VKETEPSIERNSSKLGIISFFKYTANTGMLCTHSFLAPNLMTFKQHKDHKHVDEIVLYTGFNGDVFFFNKKFDSADPDKENFELCLQVINKE
jgi:hypothetical protein